MNVVVVIPWRSKGDAYREANFQHVLDYLINADVGEVLVCDDGATRGPFNRSAAYNAGRRHRPDADCYVWHEADMIVPVPQLRAAVRLATASPGLVVPFNTYAYLSKAGAAEVLEGASPFGAVAEYKMGDGRSVGAVGVTSSATLTAVGQWDEKFKGWGYDDRAMCRAFQVATGRDTRYAPGYGFHLWHPPAWEADGTFRGGTVGVPLDERQATEANKRRLARYKSARTPEQIRALTR
jgi:hypothetical protein